MYCTARNLNTTTVTVIHTGQEVYEMGDDLLGRSNGGEGVLISIDEGGAKEEIA
jgi:hypothetical protein